MVRGDARLETKLAAVADAGARAWPKVKVTREVFVKHLMGRLPTDVDPAIAVEATHASDLYLACGCALGDPAALADLDRTFIAQIMPPPTPPDVPPIAAEELRQMLRARLLVATKSEPARIAGYTGRGPLSIWLRVAAARLVVDLRRSTRVSEPLDQQRSLKAAGPDPEMAYLKARYGREFEEAFEASLAALSAREGSIIRLFHLEGMTNDGIGALYKVTGRTVQRWVAEIRKKLLAETHRRLAERLRLTEKEMGSIYQLVQSQIALNIPDRLRR